jgi:hypothetical protein
MIMRPLTLIAYAICAVLMLFGAQSLLLKGSVAWSQFLDTGKSSLPEYLVSEKDAVSGLTVTRITKPGKMGEGVECGADHCGHRYSSAQAWNADQSLLVLATGCSGYCFLDGRTYKPLFFRARPDSCEWHPKNPDQMICVDGRTIRLWSPRMDTDTIAFDSKTHKNLQFGPGKGNPSRDGDRIAVRAVSDAGVSVVFVYDIDKRIKYPDIELSRLPGKNQYCTIAPLGEKLVCFQLLADGLQQTFILHKNGDLLQSWLENHRPGHGDMTVDADGVEIMVGISKSAPDKYQVVSRRLDTGAVTQLLPYGEATHVSLRSISREGWAIVSYEGDPEEIAAHPKWAPYGREIIAVALDGSKQVLRIARTNNIKTGYLSEAHASPSPDGSQVVWSSNWGDPKGPVYDFVTKVIWPDEKKVKRSKTQ